ncbi:ribosome maturation factor RimM [Zhihengliuella alba]|uniref:Ribosome maturation factor RimM n=1 Tax=Zhihengliuella alba TaxID=547018 RepID=A0ABP7CNE3_9MICC
MRLQVARIGKPHGIRGEVTVQITTDAPEDRFVPGRVFAVEPEQHGPLTLTRARWNKEILLLTFEEVADRNRAEELRGARLFIEADEESDSEESDEWFAHELVGLALVVDGQRIGQVTGLRSGAVQDLLEVELDDGEEVLLPFVEEIVPEVDLEAGEVVATPPPGLLDVNRANGEQEG